MLFGACGSAPRNNFRRWEGGFLKKGRAIKSVKVLLCGKSWKEAPSHLPGLRPSALDRPPARRQGAMGGGASIEIGAIIFSCSLARHLSV